MRWFWQRRKRQATVQSPAPTAQPVTQAIRATASTASSVQRAASSSGRLGQPRELTSPVLLLARDYLHAIGGRVRVEDDDVLSATLPDGSLVRYTITQAKARADESMTLLVEGSQALAVMLDDIAARSRMTALRLTPAADPAELALAVCRTPTSKCGRCLDASDGLRQEPFALCDVCPLRENRLALRWRAGGPLSARVERREEAGSVELAYLMVARDRQGRHDEWLRSGFDMVTGQSVATLSDAALTSAVADDLPATSTQQLAVARTAAERALGDCLTATGLFLRQRSLDEYQTRLEEVATTFDRLQRESPENARAVKSGRKRELAALAEVYGVDIEAQLESACFITSPHAIVALRPRKARGDLLLRVDLGRGLVIPPNCAVCNVSVQAGDVCEAGHVVCASCAAACSRCGAWSCVTCGEPRAASVCVQCGHAQQPARISAPVETTESLSAGTLTVAHLDALPTETWLAAAEWMLTRQRITVESRRSAGDMTLWQGTSAAGATVVATLRLPARRAFDEITIRQAAAHLAPEQPAVTRMLLTTAPVTAEARQAAQRFGIEVMDRAALEALLSEIVSAHGREREYQLSETQARADAASAARQAMLDAMDAVDHALAPLRRIRRANTTALAGVAASRTLASARNTLERAALAWETLLAEWTGAFGERADRQGRLAFEVVSDRFAEMTERAAHLQAALLDAIALLAEAPTRGEPGYIAWRQAILDECATRFEAWRWRIRSYDPAAWSDFRRAWNAKAATKAAEAVTAAGHATARADKAQAQALRAG